MNNVKYSVALIDAYGDIDGVVETHVHASLPPHPRISGKQGLPAEQRMDCGTRAVVWSDAIAVV